MSPTGATERPAVVTGPNLVLLGAPASGKGTQAELISAALGIPAVSTGVIIRAEIARGTPLGNIAARFLAKGELLPDAETLQLVRAWLSEGAKEGFILDGFPRTVPQAAAFDRMLEATGLRLDAAIFLDVPREHLEARILDRLQCSGCGRAFHTGNPSSPGEGESCPACGAAVGRRDDDTSETFALRYREYEAKSEPLVGHYGRAGLLKRVDGRGTPAKVFGDVLHALGLPLRSDPAVAVH